MTHEAGIESAAETLVTEMHPDFLDMQGARHSARLIIQAYLSASGMVLAPRKATDEMKFHTLVAGYIASGASGDKALVLAKDKMIDDGYADVSDAQYTAMLAAAPDPFKTGV